MGRLIPLGGPFCLRHDASRTAEQRHFFFGDFFEGKLLEFVRHLNDPPALIEIVYSLRDLPDLGGVEAIFCDHKFSLASVYPSRSKLQHAYG
jgi:hypothetical protein